MNFRDSWEVWRRKVNKALEGQTGEISGKDVTFEGSGISATNVEDAINEVDGTVGTLSDDVTTLIGVVGDSDSGLVKDINDLKKETHFKIGTVNYTAVAGTTVVDAITGLIDKFVDDVCSLLPNNMYASPYLARIPYSDTGARRSIRMCGYYFANDTTKNLSINFDTALPSSNDSISFIVGNMAGSLVNEKHVYLYNSVTGLTSVRDNMQLSIDTELSLSYELLERVFD